jgi:GTP-binding protein Era
MEISGFKSGFIAIVGRPNVGKSTLLNAIAGEKLAIVSDKPQTTRGKVKAILTDETSQIIFVDTPGINKPRNKLGEFMVKAVESAMDEVDGIIFIIDANDRKPGAGDLRIADMLKDNGIPVILVINKIDGVKKEKLLQIMVNFHEILHPAAIVPISALKKEGVDELMDEVRKILPEGPKYFDGEFSTDSTEREIVAETIREKILQLLSDEVPHGVAVDVISFKEREDKRITDIEADIICEKDSHKGIIIGKDGAMLKRIGSLARADIEKMLDTRVFLKLWIRVREDWRNNNAILKDLGFK